MQGDSNPPAIEDRQIKDYDGGFRPTSEKEQRTCPHVGKIKPSALCPQTSAFQGGSLGKQAKIIEFCSKTTIVTIAIADIRRDGGTQQRTGLNHETVQEYSSAMRQGDKFPPVKLKYDGSNYWLIDGFHTIEAAWSIGQKSIEAEVSTGSQRDAILASVGVNLSHGLCRSNADKRRAVTTLLKDEEWGQWSDREIARRCKVSQPFVSKLRSNLTDNVISENLRSYKDKHGNTSQMNTENIGNNNSQELSLDNSEIDNSSTDKPIAKTAVQPRIPDRKTLVQEFEIGQLVKLQLAHLDGVSKQLKDANHSYGQITSLTENKCSFNLNVFDHGSFVISPEDIQVVEYVHFPVSFSPKEFISLMSIYKTKHQIELAIKEKLIKN